MEETKNNDKIQPLSPELRANMLAEEKSIFFNVALFEQAQRIANMFAASTMVPDHFRGNLGNCMIGLNYAARIKADPFMVLQSLYVVHGRPGIEGKLVEAVINQSQKYSEPLQYVWLDPQDNEVTRQEVLKAQIPSEYGCQAFTIDKKSNKRVDGPKVTWALVKAEGWYDKPGPDGTEKSNKWRTMPEMMFYYRSASWFSNKNCPELKLGMYTTEELEDIVDLRKTANGKFGLDATVASLNEQLKTEKSDESKAELYQTEEPENDKVRKEYINLKKAGFKPWVLKNLVKIPKMSEEDRYNIQLKWGLFYPDEPYPLLLEASKLAQDEPQDEAEGKTTPEYANPPDAHPGEPDEERMLSLLDGAEIEKINGDRMILVKCPNRPEDGEKVNVKWCQQNCTNRTGCPTWAFYDKATEPVQG